MTSADTPHQDQPTRTDLQARPATKISSETGS